MDFARSVGKAAATLLLLASGAARGGDVDLASDAVRKLLAVAATRLAQAGRAPEAREVVAVCGKLAYDSAALAKLKDACDAAAKAPKAAAAAPEAAKSLREAASGLAASLATADAPTKERLARLVLTLDGTQAAAHQALGHVRHAGKWVPAEMPACLAARAKSADAVLAARRLPVETTETPSPLESIARVAGGPGTCVSSHGVSLHSARLPRDKLERILRQTLRALAFSEFARGGELRVPETKPPADFVLYGTKADYRTALAEALTNHGIDAATAERCTQTSAFFDARGPSTGWKQTEADWEASLFLQISFHLKQAAARPQACLAAGHINWVLLQFVGAPLPGVAWIETETTAGRGGKTSDQRTEDERNELFRLAKRSLVGARAWMQWLARRSEDPAWSRSMVEEIGKIQGNDLAKCTLVAEYLQELGLYEKTNDATRAAPNVPEAMAAATGGTLADFEQAWRDWLLVGDLGLAERVDAPPPADMTPEERRFLPYLDDLRAKAIFRRDRKELRPLRPEPELSAGCRLHSLYLVKHREQLAKWPDAHEEYPDRPEFTPQGARAGLSSVIAPGVKTPEEAIDGWMGTFYHRLPLLHPALLRVGFALEGGVATLDAGSMVASMPMGTWCVWPAIDARDVPRRFDPELPDPVPGADQSQWGYAVTAQFFSWDTEPSVRMQLLLGGAPVDCFFSTPDAPTNPELAPAGTFCLIPKKPLQPNATYTVCVEDMPQLGHFEWKFTTGR